MKATLILASRLTHDLRNTSLKGNLEYFASQGLKFEFGGDVIFYSVNPGEREVGEFSNVLPIYSENDTGGGAGDLCRK